MLWNTPDTPVEHRQPLDITEAIDLLEGALSVVERGWSEAERINAEAGMSADDGAHPSQMEMRFTEPPSPENRQDSVVKFKWDRAQKSLLGHGSGFMRGVKPQTVYMRVGGGEWGPCFHAQVQADISAAVKYLAPRCEQAGWSADPLDLLIAWNVETDAHRDAGIMQGVHLLIAKLRRKHGLPGGNFIIPPQNAQAPLPASATQKLQEPLPEPAEMATALMSWLEQTVHASTNIRPQSAFRLHDALRGFGELQLHLLDSRPAVGVELGRLHERILECLAQAHQEAKDPHALVNQDWQAPPPTELGEPQPVAIRMLTDEDAITGVQRLIRAVWELATLLRSIKNDLGAAPSPTSPPSPDPATPTLKAVPLRREVWFGPDCMAINAGADYAVLAALLAADRHVVTYPNLLRCIKPNELAATVSHMTEAPQEVKDAVNHINKALRGVRAPWKVEAVRKHAYKLTRTIRADEQS
jgi:hypothetical protein